MPSQQHQAAATAPPQPADSVLEDLFEAAGAWAGGPVPAVGETGTAGAPGAATRTASEQAYDDAFAAPGEDGGGGISGPEPPPEVPKWYQHKSTAVPRGDAKATIYFGTDQDTLTPDDLAAIDQLAEDWADILQSGDWQVEVLGYADERADEEYNDDLAARRAAKVFEELGVRGVLPEGSGFATMGEQASSPHPDDLARQRRVEIRIVPKREEDPDKDFPLPPIPGRGGGPDPLPPWAPPADWSTEWQMIIHGSANASHSVVGGEVVRLTIENLKTNEKLDLTYIGGGLDKSLAPIGTAGPGGPYPFETSKPVPISAFRLSWGNVHAQLGASASIPLPLEEFDLPNGVSGEVWILRGPEQLGADTIVIPGGGAGNASPNVGGAATIGPMR
jgi:outer membrane protein OmpA-like peptidoglycan-associated protein